jgi:hypothetical protein
LKCGHVLEGVEKLVERWEGGDELGTLWALRENVLRPWPSYR